MFHVGFHVVSIQGGEGHRVFNTRSGTAPGSPIADVEFVQGPPAPCRPAPACCATPQLDDADKPEAVLEIARTAICEFTAELHQIGISLNTDAGNADLVPIFQWPGSQQARQTWLCAYGAQLPVPLPTGGQIFLTMSDGYTHLGSVISACGSDLPDIFRRAALAREMIGPLRRLCRNSELSTVWWWATLTPEATQVDALPACAPWQGPLLHCFLRFSVPPRIIDHGI